MEFRRRQNIKTQEWKSSSKVEEYDNMRYLKC